MKACVTGGTGFVGSHIVRVLNDAGHEVRVLHRQSSKLLALEGLHYESMIGDLSDVEALKTAFAGCDWVFHVAAVADYWQADRDWMFEVNVEGTRRVLQAAREVGVQRVIFTSSAAAVGMPTDDTPSDESVAFNLDPEQFPYGYSKVLAEEVVQAAIAQHGQDVVILNPTVIIGPGDLNMISGSFIVQMAKWGWLTPISGGGLAVIDVRDVAKMHLAAAEKGQIGERYILNNTNYTYTEWYGVIAKAIGVAAPLVTTPNWVLPAFAGAVTGLRRVGINTPVDANQVRLGGRFVYFDGRKAHQALRHPDIAMADSVRETYEWYQAHGYITSACLSNLVHRARGG